MARTVVPWSALAELTQVAALLGREPGELRGALAALPPSIEGLALVEGERVRALGLFVRTDLARTGRCSLVWLSAPAPSAALELAAEAEVRAAREGARALVVGEKHVRGAGPLLLARGYAQVNAMLRLRRTRRRPVLPLPAGLAERSLDDVGLDAWVEVENAAFEDVAFAVRVTRADAERQRAAPAFDGGLLRFLVDAEGVAGMLRGVIAPDGTGEVESIGLAARARRRELGRWLLRRCEALLDQRSAREVVLRVAASNAPALALYRAEGYEELGRDVAWERALDRPG
ncbi:GNAT family N-acetyltransferase [Anaeromyxobacter diazotrophicus]|uniref:N-acetyltransferase domain-containing protein n=1 Tax=Anaeromyxobacter diazotrophicus TaxID=2590199 RepID=A0A7I9VRE7_9BACT|nr:N-acetyltransferase [Anaeromyxobacter diazotrophicus]GEJ58993.1 hypothetical protein AMYX_37340 [Anaeromyxobacter diazotrophicus]